MLQNLKDILLTKDKGDVAKEKTEGLFGEMEKRKDMCSNMVRHAINMIKVIFECF